MHDNNLRNAHKIQKIARDDTSLKFVYFKISTYIAVRNRVLYTDYTTTTVIINMHGESCK